MPRGIRPLAALLVSAAYASVLVHLPSPTPAAVALATAEIVILPPGEPVPELASIGSPDAAAAQASEVLEEVTATSPEASEVTTIEDVATEVKPETQAAPAPPILTAPPPIRSVDTAVAVSPEKLEPAERSPPQHSAELPPVPAKRDAVRPTETDKRKPDPKPKPAKQNSAASRAQRGQAGSGGGQRSTSGQSVAAYAAQVRSVLVARAQRIKNLRASGRVGLTFTIDGGGRLASLSLRSSGSSQVDQAIRSALRGISFPPPPNGRFTGSITITVQ